MNTVYLASYTVSRLTNIIGTFTERDHGEMACFVDHIRRFGFERPLVWTEAYDDTGLVPGMLMSSLEGGRSYMVMELPLWGSFEQWQREAKPIREDDESDAGISRRRFEATDRFDYNQSVGIMKDHNLPTSNAGM